MRPVVTLRHTAYATHALLIAAGCFGGIPSYGTTRDVANVAWSAPFVLAGVLGLAGVRMGAWWLERSALIIAVIGIGARIAMLATMAFTHDHETAARCLILALLAIQLIARHLRITGPALDPMRSPDRRSERRH